MDLHVRPLAEGPLDFIGDVHGEVDVLRELLAHLGYDASGAHPDGRTVVFLGDLVDRGPDSLETVRLVRGMIERGKAQCVVGNHELNLVLGKERAGNSWFWGRQHHLRGGGAVIPQRLIGDAEREEVLLFVQSLPLALERSDARAVHACWDDRHVAALRDERRGLADLFYETERDLTLAAAGEGHDHDSLDADLARQNGNPITKLTSGHERPAQVAFRAGGQLRRVERVAWWDRYEHDATVVFGHYWRSTDPIRRAAKRGPYLFRDVGWDEPLGPRRNAWCIDYSIGGRNVARVRGHAPAPTALFALRFPEHELVDDAGRVHRPAR